MQSRTSLVVVTALISVVVTSLVWLAGIGIVYWFMFSDPPPFVVKVDAPQEVVIGETITVKIQVTNPTDSTLELGSIDLSDTLLNGFSDVQYDPKPDDKDHTLDFSSVYYSKSLNPQETFSITLTMKAAQVGVWTGDLDFCTPMENFISSSVTIRVKEKEGAVEEGAAKPLPEAIP